MIVVDANVLVLPAIESDANGVASRIFAIDDIWIAPVLWRSEFLSILAAYLRLRDWTLEQAVAAYEVAESLISQDGSVEPDAILRLITESSCTAYDLEYVALAHAYNVPLVTFDRQLLREFPAVAISPADFIAAH